MLENIKPSDLPIKNNEVKEDPFKMPDIKGLPPLERPEGHPGRGIELSEQGPEREILERPGGRTIKDIGTIPDVKNLPPLDSIDKVYKSQEDMPSTHSDSVENASISEQVALTPLSNESKEDLEELGYPNSIIENIGSEEEKEIYENANVEPTQINGRDVLVKQDIDLEQTDDLGRTNLERMEQGLAPLDKNGKPIELHHIGQKMDSPLVELTAEEHRGKGNDTILHDKQKESEIDRADFAKERAEHWKARAAQIKQDMNTKE